MKILKRVAWCGTGVVLTACAFSTQAHTEIVSDAATAPPDTEFNEVWSCDEIEDAVGALRTAFRPRSLAGILRAQRKSRITCCGYGGPLVHDAELIVGRVSYPCYAWWSVLVASEVARFSTSESGQEVVTWGGRRDTPSGRAARGWYDSFVAARELPSDFGGLRGTTRVTDDGVAACTRHGEDYGCRFEVAPAIE